MYDVYEYLYPNAINYTTIDTLNVGDLFIFYYGRNRFVYKLVMRDLGPEQYVYFNSGDTILSTGSTSKDTKVIKVDVYLREKEQSYMKRLIKKLFLY